ncbi:MAG: signal peptidase I [Bacteriovoracia bacterium]
MENPEQPTPSAGKSRKKWLIENVTSIGIAFFLVLMVRSSIIEAYKIPSGSMIPTLLIGDHIFVNKFAYGFKLPFTEWFGDPVYLIRRDPPKRGDVIVFKYPKDESLYYIKRIVATSGDTVELKDKRLIINGQPIASEPLSADEAKQVTATIDPSSYNLSSLKIFHEKMQNDTPTVMVDSSTYSIENFGPITVPQDQYFVMGDNRDHSNDSRFWGFVPMQNIKGKAMVIWLSLWVDFKEGLYYFRPGRIGTVLHGAANPTSGASPNAPSSPESSPGKT